MDIGIRPKLMMAEGWRSPYVQPVAYSGSASLKGKASTACVTAPLRDLRELLKMVNWGTCVCRERRPEAHIASRYCMQM